MKYHKKHLLAFLSSALLLTTGCEKDLLDQPNPNLPTAETFWKNSQDATKGIVAAYSGLQLLGNYRRWIYFDYDLRSDEGFSSSPWPELQNFTKFILTDYNFEVNAVTWGNHYVGINRCNQVLAYVPAIQMDGTLKTQILAEARFIRALHYFNLVSLYGRPVLATEPSTADYRPPQASSEQEAWDFIVQDLQAAKAGLPVSYSGADLGRATKGAATALLGKAYMQQQKWAEASTQLAEVISSGRYSLAADYRDNFRHDRENNSESVFEVQFTAEYSADRDDDYAGASEASQRAQFFGLPSKGWTDGEARSWLIDEFLREKTTTGRKDPRLAATLFFSRNRTGYPYDATDPVDQDDKAYDNQTLDQRFSTDAYNRNRVYWRKYENDYWKNVEGYYSPINHRVIRYSDVLLSQAECLNEQGKTTDAMALINLVRRRVGLADLSGLSQSALRTQLMHERVTELAGETWRWHDLRRWGLLDNQAGIDQLKSRDPDFSNYVVGRSKYLPIPRTDVDIAGLAQNPGWN
ncbi:RagB/SusD family nutrient uptake outer membrane protein [Hymenobacter sp. HSC-4F20]|uniref:RagB/SusD family nutrient uptake outer membrane protein n=1 Tax=Hymenobacter sp. HSC-4F20 TaxID=2864135 RepID=UPI001C73CA9D|nr:RagB/SusD family nutrient uptake outer membrane protein [Hymenobacter sp. HSC-4F20]MBX0292319.1 RagB/SusD family nutrient uptake outer membrane protein [Hymenobacter sp. HSC-4F20]